MQGDSSAAYASPSFEIKDRDVSYAALIDVKINHTLTLRERRVYVKCRIYSGWTILAVCGKYVSIVLTPMIAINLDHLLKQQKRTFYWLAKETGISHTTLWRLKKDKALGINFETLEKICQALGCKPGDVLMRVEDKKAPSKRSKAQNRK